MHYLFALLLTTSAHSLEISKVAGMYMDPITIEVYNGPNGPSEKVKTEDVLEIVPYEKDRAYFRTVLNRDNGHSCDFSGIAVVEGESLVYKKPETTCVFRIHFRPGKIYFEDTKENSCKDLSCGMRGSYGMEDFKPAKRREIRYMKRLKESSQYLAAVKELESKASVSDKVK